MPSAHRCCKRVGGDGADSTGTDGGSRGSDDGDAEAIPTDGSGGDADQGRGDVGVVV